MKFAKVIPLFKNFDPENITNYRPVSVLSCFSKVLERIILKAVWITKMSFYRPRYLPRTSNLRVL